MQATMVLDEYIRPKQLRGLIIYVLQNRYDIIHLGVDQLNDIIITIIIIPLNVYYKFFQSMWVGVLPVLL